MKVRVKESLEQRLKQHFSEVLSVSITLQPWAGQGALPPFLRDPYAFVTAPILGTLCLFMLDLGTAHNAAATISKHLFEVSKRWNGEAIYVAAGIDSARRKRLIEQRVPFVVPGNQVYLPMLGIDLREHFHSARGAPDSFSPSTQATLLHALCREVRAPLSLQEMAATLGYTSMTLSRAFDELEAAGIGRHWVEGRRRLMELAGPRRQLWDKAHPLLRSPVARRVHIEQAKGGSVGLIAGYSALAFYASLAAPRSPVVAVASIAWPRLRDRLQLGEADAADPGLLEVELWFYRPEAIAGGPVVDRLSLYLSLAGANDERVEAALDELLEGMAW